jgi:hypothetical protein
MAAKLLIEEGKGLSVRLNRISGGAGPAQKSMNRESQSRFVAVVLFLATVAAVVFASFNFQKEKQWAEPDDGVWWIERGGHLVADRVDGGGQGAKAGIKAGDVLVAINDSDVKSTSALEQQLYTAGVWHNASYSLVRDGVSFDCKVLLQPADRSLNSWLRLIALIYLGIGLYVLLRRWTAPGSTHFYIFCLVSFIAYSFKYTGKLNDFDWTIYWSNIVAWLLQPALFLHFVLTFPEKRHFVRHRPGCSVWPIFRQRSFSADTLSLSGWPRPAEVCAGTWTGKNLLTARSCSSWPQWCSGTAIVALARRYSANN